MVIIIIATIFWIPICLGIYQPCPILGAYFGSPTLNDTIADAVAAKIKGSFDRAISQGLSGDYGDIASNTTSISIAIFGSKSSRPVFFEYHHSATEQSLNKDTVYPIGDLTQLWTVTAWLREHDTADWLSPITKFLPELHGHVSWEDVTINSLTSNMAGIVRSSGICTIDQCDKAQFLHSLSDSRPWFQPFTTPIVSHASFQLLGLALEKQARHSYQQILGDMLRFTGMKNSGLISDRTIDSELLKLQGTQGEPCSLGGYSTISDLAKFGLSILDNKLIKAQTVNWWLQPVSSTSNLRNAVGAPWEIYHAGTYSNSSILDIYTKSGYVGNYSSYFGLSMDFDVGFVVLAHDPTGGPDLNVYVDLISDSIGDLVGLAYKESSATFDGTYKSRDGKSTAVIKASQYGLEVKSLQVDGVDIVSQVANLMKTTALDFKLYPSNIQEPTSKLFVPIFQDKNAPVDKDTPTCITWQTVGAILPKLSNGFSFTVDRGRAKALNLLGFKVSMTLSR